VFLAKAAVSRDIRNAIDSSKGLFEKMPLVVFYDRNDPRNNVGLPCSFFEIEM
jgi:hypothetical protein